MTLDNFSEVFSVVAERMMDNWPIYWLAVLAGIIFGVFYSLKLPYAHVRRQLTIGLMVFLTLHFLLITNYIFAFHAGSRTVEDAFFLMASPTARWWLFIFASAATIGIIQWWTRRKNDRLP